MAFACTAPTKGPHPAPIRNENGYLVAVPVGYDDEEGLDYTLLVGFEPLPGGDYEFFFCVVEASVTTNRDYVIWSGREMGKKVAKYDRKMIRSCLFSVTEHLALSVSLNRFSMTTHDENLPEEALEKFRLLNDIFTQCGYIVSERERRFGNHSWRMERG